jgi:hypothetical protein
VFPDFGKMDGITCPDCNEPLVALPVEGTNKYQFHGCSCEKQTYQLPDCFVAGLAGGPMFFYQPRQTGLS